MTGRADGDGDFARLAVAALLREAEARGIRIPIWWRDDDAETATPQLDRLLAAARRHGIPLGLAVIPHGAARALADRLAGEAEVRVLQHGWRHRQNNAPGAKKSELGDDRPLPIVLDELRAGSERLRDLFPQHFLPVLVPPWNRIAAAVAAARREAGLPGLSTFGPRDAAEPHQVNTHVDILTWRPRREPASRAQAFALLAHELRRRLASDPEPIGILTHHLMHEEASWALVDELLDLLADHPATEWPSLPDLFALPRN